MQFYHMEAYTREYAKQFGARKRLGQNFLLDGKVAETEAKFAKGRAVLEIGPGLGILTEALCSSASKVLAVEKDTRLFSELEGRLRCRNLRLINSDFFDLGVETRGYDMLVSNIPYNLSSKTLFWIIRNRMEAVLCLQKEFVEHMVAKSGTRKYSRLSVTSSLTLNVEKVMEVDASSFYPKPKVDSEVVHITCRDLLLTDKESDMISLIMEHKKKKLRNAVIDSASKLGIGKMLARHAAERLSSTDARVFAMKPEEILASARELISVLGSLE
jgi:16S rRNA (adenine1518-N6/adenine1519-N6)-dimethyltransferase